MKKYLPGICGFAFLIAIIILYLTIGGKYSSYLHRESYLKDIPDFFKDHFPDNVDYYESTKLSLSYAKAEIKKIRSVEFTSYYIDKELIKEIKENLKKESLIVYRGTDINLVEVGFDTRRISCDTCFHLIPEFYYKNQGKSGLNGDFEIFILQSESGSQISPELKNYSKIDLKNGYSKGVSVNEKERVVIFWFLVW